MLGTEQHLLAFSRPDNRTQNIATLQPDGRDMKVRELLPLFSQSRRTHVPRTMVLPAAYCRPPETARGAREKVDEAEAETKRKTATTEFESRSHLPRNRTKTKRHSSGTRSALASRTVGCIFRVDVIDAGGVPLSPLNRNNGPGVPRSIRDAVLRRYFRP